MNFTIPVYQRKEGSKLHWTTLTLGKHTKTRNGRNSFKVQQALVNDLKKLVEKPDIGELERFQFIRGIWLKRIHLELTLRGAGKKRSFSGIFPLVLEPRHIDQYTRIYMVYHPAGQGEWFPLEDDDSIEEKAAKYFQEIWANLPDSQLETLRTNSRDRIKTISFSAQSSSLLDRLPDYKGGIWDYLLPEKNRKKKTGKRIKILRELGVNLTRRAIDGSLPPGMPRSPYREQLRFLLAGDRRRPTLVAGPPQVGKSLLINRLVHDLLQSEGYEVHRNLDKVHHIWSISGQRIIAGMSYVGDWEQRCMDLLQEVKKNRIILLIEDIHVWGRIGLTRDCDRNLADFFRGPLARAEIVVTGECTFEQLRQLEEDAPSFANLFSRIYVAETTPTETSRMMLHQARLIEAEQNAVFDPLIFREIIEMAGPLFPGIAFPGKALDLMRELARQPADKPDEAVKIDIACLLHVLSRKTGLPEILLRPEDQLDPESLREEFQQQIIGQTEAVEAVCNLILRIRTGLVDPKRPFGVCLFSGPTGTGKTELAKCLAEYLYSDRSRLLRFDMSEFSTSDAPARLIGDRFSPKGMLTEQVRQQPFCVLLLDEIEKAHPGVLNLLLQLFDEGRLTDAAGMTADFTHTVIIMTSNLGAGGHPHIGLLEPSTESKAAETVRAVRDFFPPELFNRIDHVLSFSPLTKDAARKIAAKELSDLLARRGLIDRNIFVYTTRNLLSRIVQEGFDPVYGARTVKRYLEQKIGSKLAEQISCTLPAELQVLMLFTDNRKRGNIKIHVESLAEAAIVTQNLPLEPLFSEPMHELHAMLPGTLDFLDSLLESQELEHISERIRYHLKAHKLGGAGHADTLFNLDSIRLKLRKLRGKVGYIHMTKRADKQQILQCFAEIHFLRQTFDTVENPGQHSVFLEILKIGLGQARSYARSYAGSYTRFDTRSDTGHAGLMAELANACRGQLGELNGFAARVGNNIIDGDPDRGPGLSEVLGKHPQHLVLNIVGLNVLDFYAGENGCHIWRSLSSGTEVVRVRVWPAQEDQKPVNVIEDHLEQVRDFETSLESGSEEHLTNPEHLMPLVREYRFDPPQVKNQSTPLEIIDYSMGYVETFRVRRLAEGFPRIWILRMSREKG